jgi:hypothetical protein
MQSLPQAVRDDLRGLRSMLTFITSLCRVNLPVPTKKLQILRAQLLVLLRREATFPIMFLMSIRWVFAEKKIPHRTFISKIFLSST